MEAEWAEECTLAIWKGIRERMEMRGVGRLAMNRRWPAVEEGDDMPREKAAEDMRR
jgi:hypothetical protein